MNCSAPRYESQLLETGPHDQVRDGFVVQEVVDETLVAFYAEEIVDALAAEIAVDQEHRLTELTGEGESEVDGASRLAFAGQGTCHHDGLAARQLGLLTDLGADAPIRLDVG